MWIPAWRRSTSSCWQGKHNVNLVMQTTNPAVTNDATAESLGITELTSEYTSYFYGSDAARIQNISTAASRFHGLLIAPGAIVLHGGCAG